jgi:molybdopterin-binding protein
VSSRASIKTTIQAVLDGGKDAYVWPILQPRIEVSSRAIIKATIQTIVQGAKDAYV